MANPVNKVCECSSGFCSHHIEPCRSRRDLGLYRVNHYRQTLCGGCAAVARQFCDAYGYAMDTLVSAAEHRRRTWKLGDWVCAGVLVAAVAWIVITILPAFFDGRVAQVVGR